MSSKTKVNITDKGFVVLSITDDIELKDYLDHNEVDALINTLKTAQTEADELLKIANKRKMIVSNYNGTGKTIKI